MRSSQSIGVDEFDDSAGWSDRVPAGDRSGCVMGGFVTSVAAVAYQSSATTVSTDQLDIEGNRWPNLVGC